jgi:hypothetical protein
MHHNPQVGEISHRFGVKHPQRLLREFANMGVDLVLCGHDHQEAIRRAGGAGGAAAGPIVATAGTVSDRSRGGRPSSVNAVHADESGIEVTTLVWSDAAQTFAPGPVQRFPRRRG